MQPRRSKNGFLMVPRAQGISKEHRPWSVPLHCSTVERDQVGPVMGSEYGLRIWLMLKRIFLFFQRDPHFFLWHRWPIHKHMLGSLRSRWLP